MLVLNPYPQTPFPGKGAILLGLPPLVQARMLAVSHTKPLHDAVTQMADNLYGGYAPATPFLSTIEVFDSLIFLRLFCNLYHVFLSNSISAFSSEIGSFSSPEIILAISLFLPSKSSFVMPV